MKVLFGSGDRYAAVKKTPMSEARFRVICGLLAAWVYANMVKEVASSCGVLGLIVVALTTLLLSYMWST